MSMGGTTQSSGTSTSINQIPAWMTDAGQKNYAFAENVANQPLQQYGGQMVADTSPQTQQSWNTAANSGNVGNDQYSAGTAGYLGALSQTPMQVSAGGPTQQVNNPGNANAVTAGQLANTNLDPYMNPFTSSVIDATTGLMRQSNALDQNQLGNAAASSGAFGGSRQGIQQGVAQAQGAMNIGQMAAQLNAANFAQAQAGATGDINRRLTADTQNQNSQQTDLARQNTDLLANQSANAADLQRQLTAGGMNQTAQQNKINSDILASQGLTNTGDSMNKANVANFNMQQSAGAGQSMQQQNEINAQMAKFNQAFNYPQQQLGTLLSALGMTPHDTSTSNQNTSQQTTPTDWANLIAKGAQTAGSLYGMSDKTMKTDITKLGKDPKTGLDMHAFRYKGDPKSYPKVVGPMAQDVKKKYPEMVEPMGKEGKLAIRGYAGGTAFVPDMDDADLGDQIQGGGMFGGDKVAAGLQDIGDIWGGDGKKKKAEAEPQSVQGWNAPSMGYFRSGFARGAPNVQNYLAPMTMPPSKTDTVPAMLTPGEAVLTPMAAQHVGRGNIAALNAMMPPVERKNTTAMRAGARGLKGALANTKLRPKVMGALGG